MSERNRLTEEEEARGKKPKKPREDERGNSGQVNTGRRGGG